MQRQVNFEAQREHDFIPNYKQLQLALTASGVTKVGDMLAPRYCMEFDGFVPCARQTQANIVLKHTHTHAGF